MPATKAMKPQKAQSGNETLKNLKKHWRLLIFIIPALVYVIIFQYLPMYGIIIAFEDFKPYLGYLGSKWVGFKHFQRFFTSPNFWPLLKNTVFLSVLQLLITFPIPVILALSINQLKVRKYQKAVQLITYAPHFISVDVSLHEAAVIDGAGTLQRIRYIDFPSILPTVITILILNTGKIMSIGFEKVYAMQNALNLSTSSIIPTYVYQIGILEGQYSYSAAINLFNSVINLVLLLTVNQIAKKTNDTGILYDGALKVRQDAVEMYKPYILPTERLYPRLMVPQDQQARYSELETDINKLTKEQFASWITKGGIEQGWDAYLKNLETAGLPEYLKLSQTFYDEFNKQYTD